MSLSLSYSSPEEAGSIINKYFEGTDVIFSSLLNFKAVKWEAARLNESESVLSDRESMNLHLDLILNGGADAVTDYHKGLALGENKILEKAKSFSKDPKKLDESLVKFKRILKEKLISSLNEQGGMFGGMSINPLGSVTIPQGPDLATRFASAVSKAKAQTAIEVDKKKAEAVAAATSNAEVDQALAGGEHTGSSDDGAWGVLWKLWNAVTEGGSGIGILHLVLDVVGVIGDFIVPGLGAIADVINAIIYFCREKWMLGTISLLAGLLVGAGDALKLLKGFAGPAEKVMISTIKNGTEDGAKQLAKIQAKERGGVLKLLRYIAKNIGGVLGTAMGMLSKFFDGFLSSAVGWIPLIGTPLKNFFKSIGGFFSKYADNMKSFSKGFSKVEKEAMEIAAKQADETLEAFYKSEGKMVIDPKTGIVTCTDKGGKVIGEFSAEVFTNPKVINKKYPNLFKAGETEAIAKYYTAIAKSTGKLTTNTATRLEKLKLASIKAGKRLPFFIGKQVIKLISGKEWDAAGYKAEEVDYFGNSALQSWINERISKEREESGATYLPALNLDSSETEVMDRITKYQNNYAKLFGQPQIINVVYDKYGNEEVEEDFKVFWEEVGKERKAELEKLKQEDREKDETAKNKKEANESVSLKYIVPFSKFVN